MCDIEQLIKSPYIRRLICALVFGALLVFSSQANAITYYVDFDGGDDANNGTSKSTPFRTIPGTYKADGSAILRNAWGSITSSARVTDGTIFKIKSGTTHSAAEGGVVWLGLASGHFYSGGFTSLVFETDITWGDGTPAIIDGTGMSVGIALILIQIDGVTLVTGQTTPFPVPSFLLSA